MTERITLSTVRETGVNTSLALHPAWTMAAEQTLRAAQHRTRDGSLFTYRWGAYAAYRVPLRFVPAEARALLHAWWHGAERLLFAPDATQLRGRSLCRVVNRRLPLGTRTPGLSDHWDGLLLLQATDGRVDLGRPFVLDHPVDGRLDDPGLSVI